ncbi:hypothetical protein QIH87_47310 [Bradyrhizobium elkanii]|uniref:hypothetical protein n=1 Tax=Bradyrhizobium elkanii TaxID=29448 RepID=UPI0027152504|nr:hypothetical protein [Bradyrhizobium elkanii]WLB09464.1 hypothetical protein QIH87_47310 [Bradyrhizobium elkanii]WLB72590.1 hypothetical protein QIH89_01020 [Bradyrhizobium elkanii]
MRVTVFALIIALHSFCASAETQWEHNWSVLSLAADGSSRVFTYVRPRDGLPVGPGTTLFFGTRVGNTYHGTAHVFSQRCGATPYAVSGPVSQDQRSVSMYGRRPKLDASCRIVAYADDNLVFNLIEPNVLGETINSDESTLICLRPVFIEEMRLRDRIDGNRATTIWVAQAINHLNAKYCRLVDEIPTHDDSVQVKDTCFQYTGMFRGERVFWGGCHE